MWEKANVAKVPCLLDVSTLLMGYFFLDNNQHCSQIKGHQDNNKWRKYSSTPVKGMELQLLKVFKTQTQDKPYQSGI